MTGPNPTDRAKRGTKYHVVVPSDGLLLAAFPSAANVHDTMLFTALLGRALVVCAAIARLYADAAYHSAENRRRCATEGILPPIHIARFLDFGDFGKRAYRLYHRLAADPIHRDPGFCTLIGHVRPEVRGGFQALDGSPGETYCWYRVWVLVDPV